MRGAVLPYCVLGRQRPRFDSLLAMAPYLLCVEHDEDHEKFVFCNLVADVSVPRQRYYAAPGFPLIT